MARLRHDIDWRRTVIQSVRRARRRRDAYTPGLSSLSIDVTWYLETPGSCSSAYSGISVVEGMGLRRFFLRHDGSDIFPSRNTRSDLGVIPFVATLTADSRVVVLQATVQKNRFSSERKLISSEVVGKQRAYLSI